MKALRLFFILLFIGIALPMLIGTAHATEIWFTDTNEEADYEEERQWLIDNIQGVNTSTGKVTGSKSWMEKYLTVDYDKAVRKDGTVIEVGTWSYGGSSGVFYLKKDKGRMDLMKKIQNSMGEDNVTSKMNDIMSNIDVNPDTDAATLVINGFLPMIQIIVGLMVMLITAGMTLFSALDIAYIAFPVLRNILNERVAEGRGLV